MLITFFLSFQICCLVVIYATSGKERRSHCCLHLLLGRHICFCTGGHQTWLPMETKMVISNRAMQLQDSSLIINIILDMAQLFQIHMDNGRATGTPTCPPSILLLQWPSSQEWLQDFLHRLLQSFRIHDFKGLLYSKYRVHSSK